MALRTHRTTVLNSQVWSLSSVYRKKVYSSVFTHTLSSHLALGRTRRGPAAETLKRTGYRDERVKKATPTVQ